MVLTFTFPPPTEPWSINQEHAKHWSWRYKRIAAWKEMVGWKAVETRLNRQNLPQATVHVEIPFRVNRRRDPHNYVGTVVKAVIDGLVEVGVWPDDTPEFVAVAEPTLVVGDEVKVTIVTG